MRKDYDFTINLLGDTAQFAKSLTAGMLKAQQAVDKNKIILSVDNEKLVSSIRTSLDEVLKTLASGSQVDLSKLTNIQHFASQLTGAEEIITSLKDSISLMTVEFNKMTGMTVGSTIEETMKNLNDTLIKLGGSIDSINNKFTILDTRIAKIEGNSVGMFDSTVKQSDDASAKITTLSEKYSTLAEKLKYIKGIQASAKTSDLLGGGSSEFDSENYVNKMKEFSSAYEKAIIETKDGNKIELFSGSSADVLKTIGDLELLKSKIKDITLVKNEISNTVSSSEKVDIISNENIDESTSKVNKLKDTIKDVSKTKKSEEIVPLDGIKEADRLINKLKTDLKQLGIITDTGDFDDIFTEMKDGALSVDAATKKITDRIQSLSTKTKKDISVKDTGTSDINSKSSDIIADVAKSVDLKTDAFNREGVVVEAVVSREIELINQLNNSLIETKANAKGIGALLKSETGTSTNQTSKKKSINAVDNDTYSKNFKDWASNSVKSISESGDYSEILNAGISQSATGLVKFTADVKTATGEWKKFSSAIDSDGAMINQSLKDIKAESVEKLNNQLKKLEADDVEVFNTAQIKQFTAEATAALNKVNDTGKKLSVTVDEIGRVNISQTFKDGDNESSKLVASFENVKELLDKSKGSAKEFSNYINESFGRSKFTINIDQTGIKDFKESFELASESVDKFSKGSSKIDGYAASVVKVKNIMEEWNALELKRESGKATEDEVFRIRELNTELTKTISLYSSSKLDSTSSLGKDLGIKGLNNDNYLKAMSLYVDSLNAGELVSQKFNDTTKTLTSTFQEKDGIVRKVKLTYDELGNAIREVNVISGTSMSVFDKFAKTLKESGKRFLMYFSFSRIVSEFFQGFRNGLTYLKQFDSAMTDISYTMDATQTQFDNLGSSIITMAKDMGATVETVSQVAQIYSNLETTAAEVAELSMPTVMLANTAQTDPTTASDQIQAVLQQFDMLDSEATHIVDVYEGVSANLNVDYVLGIQAISEAVKVAGQTAADAGLSFEQLAAITGKLTERTREDGSTIGNALKTIIVRMSAASKLSGADEVDNETLSNASKSLSDVGVAVYNLDGSFRELDVIMTELNAVWDNLTDAQQSNISYQVNCSLLIQKCIKITYLIAGKALESYTTI